MKKSTQEILEINVNEKLEQKEGLSYLSWSWAWDFVLREIDDKATYSIQKFDGVPYHFDVNAGYMVMTSVTINGITREMFLPVMDSKNKAMKSVAYKYTTRNGDKTVEPASMFDINKAIMRCLTKNIAMFGLGLYIYAGEDLPEISEETMVAMIDEHEKAISEITDIDSLKNYYNKHKGSGKWFDRMITERKQQIEKK